MSRDGRYQVEYTYGEDGERSGKYSVSMAGGSSGETLYFNKMWNWRYDGLLSDREGRNSKHIYLGESRVVTKVSRADGSFTDEERRKEYFYHSDHLGSAQMITDHEGKEYERVEYTPYGEVWIEKGAMAEGGLDIVYRFTGKERDEETGLYYYGARYLDAKASRWLSTDPALGEYIPGAPVDEEARKRNGNLPGMGGVYNLINLHLYHYAGNNPVKYIDPDGNEIIIAQQKDRIPLLKMINSVSAQKYNVDSSGNLIQDGNKKNSIFGIGRSQEFSDRLQEGIESTSIISLGISDKIPGGSESGKVEEYDVAEGGGGRTSEIFGFVYVRITGKNSPNGIKMKDGSEKTYNPTEILVHELVGHAIPRVTHNNGNAVDKENAVRNEMHWKERDPHAQDDPAY